MGKHDKHIEASSQEFLENRIKDLEKRLEFANETIRKLQEQCGRMSKWASEIEANAKDVADTKDDYIKSLEQTIVALAVRGTNV
jgi:prefoldin subunit 5